MRKIGIMGGTFNPIHNAHIRMAKAAYEQYDLDEVWFMPSKNPPHKEKENIVSDEHRERMIELAIDPIERFKFSDMEYRRQGTTYTSDTLATIHEIIPDAKVYFILGGDSLKGFHKWHEPKKICDLCTILVAPRGDVKNKDLNELITSHKRRWQGECLPISMKRLHISSESIRACISRGISIDALCPQKVIDYIALHGLYGMKPLRLPKDSSEMIVLRYLSATLRPKRFLHTLGVADTAAMLAFSHGADGKKARLTGLLHDCAKYLTGDEMIDLCDRYGITLSDIERQNTALIHSKLGAYIARYRYGVTDTDMLSAISYHTTGKPGMTLLEKIIYIADYIEPARCQESTPYPLDDIRKTSFIDLDKALFKVLSDKIDYLKLSNSVVDEMTMETYDYYKERIGNE